jgi:tRNA(fMet)-specific endonuclease VapC
LNRFQLLPFTNADAQAAADLMATAAGSGRILSIQDVLLAGAAYARDFILVTRNRRDFDPIVGLRVENWFD